MSTDKFARCVTLEGDADGDPFGWFFDDNYFDLLPGEEKVVRILGDHREGASRPKPSTRPMRRPWSGRPAPDARSRTASARFHPRPPGGGRLLGSEHSEWERVPVGNSRTCGWEMSKSLLQCGEGQELVFGEHGERGGS